MLASSPCVCCQKENVCQPNKTEIHHIVDKGYRRLSGGHDSTIGLCQWHHRGISLEGMTNSEMLFKYGPSLELNKRTFIKTYGTERELLARLEESV